MLLSSTIGRNKHLIPGEVVSAIIEGTEQFCANMRDLGIGIHTTGGETADLGDVVRTVVVDSTLVARVPRKNIISTEGIKPGLCIVGLASYGKASYEQEYNGGMGSNGLTSARHDVFSSIYRERFPESYDPLTPEQVVYSGTKLLTDSVAGTPLDAGKLVLSPTRTYAPVMREVLRELAPVIGGIIHCSGGGQTKILHFLKEGRGERSIASHSAAVPADTRGKRNALARNVPRVQHGPPHGNISARSLCRSGCRHRPEFRH